MIVSALVAFHSLKRMSGRKTDSLITSGIYRYSRNPQNVGWLLCLVGIACLGRSGLALFAAAIFWLGFVSYVGAEERYLAQLYGDEYAAYRETTARYFGRSGT